MASSPQQVDSSLLWACGRADARATSCDVSVAIRGILIRLWAMGSGCQRLRVVSGRKSPPHPYCLMICWKISGWIYRRRLTIFCVTCGRSYIRTIRILHARVATFKSVEYTEWEKDIQRFLQTEVSVWMRRFNMLILMQTSWLLEMVVVYPWLREQESENSEVRKDVTNNHIAVNAIAHFVHARAEL